MKNTKQKNLILSTILNNKNHPSADEIYSLVKPVCLKISLATVYRNLNYFSKIGKIKKIHIPGLGDRFDYVTHKHEHFYCNICNNIFDVNINIENTIRQISNIDFTDYNLTLYAKCNDCTDKQK